MMYVKKYFVVVVVAAAAAVVSVAVTIALSEGVLQFKTSHRFKNGCNRPIEQGWPKCCPPKIFCTPVSNFGCTT